MPHAVVLSHDSIAHELGHLEPWLDRHGFTVTRRYRERPLPLPDADLLIVLGSPGSVADGSCPPASQGEIAAVSDWVAGARPYLGICFGAQVLAVATGGTVRRMATPFNGYVAMDLTPEAPRTLDGAWLTWHEDALTAPASGDVLGRRDHADLAFRVGRSWGLQPHVEVTPDSAERMLAALAVPELQYGTAIRLMRDNADRDAQRTAALLDAFLDDTSTTRE